ncbi:MAG TPA: hypothetical protein VFM04_06865 [Candidatus Methylomirabilis sp.]|nr:hypothetical protein [Candidatus Methylomirabilis sp.]
MARGEVSGDRRRERAVILALLIGYGGFVAGTVLIPISPTLGGIIFWAGVFVIFWAGWSSTMK